MLLACGPTSLALVAPIGLFALFVLASFPIGLAAMTSALSRRGLGVSAIDRVARANAATGMFLLIPAVFAWPLLLPALSLIAIASVTASANMPAQPPTN